MSPIGKTCTTTSPFLLKQTSPQPIHMQTHITTSPPTTQINPFGNLFTNQNEKHIEKHTATLHLPQTPNNLSTSTPELPNTEYQRNRKRKEALSEESRNSSDQYPSKKCIISSGVKIFEEENSLFKPTQQQKDSGFSAEIHRAEKKKKKKV
ncbi:hypothetical protein I3843_12G031600 [Carya illinoinensis]|nr:hypothetical protein I3843_12G031600 [Carya illinoinensis]